MFNQTSKVTNVTGNEVIGSYRYDASYNVVNGTADDIVINITELDESGADKASVGGIAIKDNIQITLVKGTDLQTQVANLATIITEIDAAATA